MDALVSVLISAYNQENFIQETISCILAQTYPDLELIVLDDGSKDSTFAKIQSLQSDCERRFARVVLETQPNAGYNATLKQLFSLAHGKYVFFCAADDLAYPQAIAEEIAFLETHDDYVLATGVTEIIDDDSRKIAWDKKRRAVPTGTKNAFATATDYFRHKRKDVDFFSDAFGSYASLLKGNYISGSFSVRKDAVDASIFLDEENLLADWYLQLQFSKSGKYKFINKPLSRLRWHGDHSLKRNYRTRLAADNTLFFESDLLEKCPEDAPKNAYVDFLTNGNKKTLFRLGHFLEIYAQKFCLRKYHILKIGSLCIPLSTKSAKAYAFIRENIKKCL